MSQRVLRQISSSGTAVTYADPDNRNNTFRIDLKVVPKKAETVSLMNSKSEFKTFRTVPVTKPGCDDKCALPVAEKVVITTTISGSIENKALVANALRDHQINIGLSSPDALSGFLNDKASYLIDADTK